jgi:type II secretory pathway pseudopilin PulG
MAYARTFQQRRRYFVKCFPIIAVIFLVASACAAQAPPAAQPSDAPWLRYLNKYPGLMDELGHLIDKLQHNVQYPPARSESRLLPLLPESTVFYTAIPNYGDVLHQALNIFQQELQESVVLRDWWQHSEVATSGPKAQDFLNKLYELSQYMGQEIVVSGAMEGREPSPLIVAEVRKPGLKIFLEQMLRESSAKSNPALRVFGPQDLATVEDHSRVQELVVLVRPDFVVGAFDLATLRSFNARLDRDGHGFASTPFGQRVARSYEGGATTLGAADLHKILSQVPPGTTQNQMALQRTGFADVKYLVWDRKSVGGQPVGQAELSFTGPRHGIASWLAAPAPLGSLDFASPRPALLVSALLTNPIQILDNVREMASASNPNAFATLATFEQAFKLSLKDDLLSQLGGEITLELDNAATPVPVWKAILRVNDRNHVQQTLNTLLVATHVPTEHFDDGGVTYYTVRIPSAKTTSEIGYAFMDGYLIIASSHEAVAEAVQVHRSGESLAKSKNFLASLPPGHPSGVSALLYEDPIAVVAQQLRHEAPEVAGAFAQLAAVKAPLVVCAYGEETAIRSESTNAGFSPGMVLVAAAIAIPSVLRSKIAANEASAASVLHAVNTAQITYAGTYPQRGYAPDLAALGPDPHGTKEVSADHAGFIDNALANASCTAGTWCSKSGYRFTLTAVCKQRLCNEYVMVGSPVNSSTGVRSFCSTSDGVIRFRTGLSVTLPVNVLECQTWSPLQ